VEEVGVCSVVVQQCSTGTLEAVRREEAVVASSSPTCNFPSLCSFSYLVNTLQHQQQPLSAMVKILSIQVLHVPGGGQPAIAVSAAQDLSSFSFYQRSSCVPFPSSFKKPRDGSRERRKDEERRGEGELSARHAPSVLSSRRDRERYSSGSDNLEGGVRQSQVELEQSTSISSSGGEVAFTRERCKRLDAAEAVAVGAANPSIGTTSR
jgi:hypothetical protein